MDVYDKRKSKMSRNDFHFKYRTWYAKSIRFFFFFLPFFRFEIRSLTSIMFSEKRSAIKRNVPAYWDITRRSVVLLCTRIRTIAARNRTTALTWTIWHEINATWTATNTAMERCWDPRTPILVTLVASVWSLTMRECILALPVGYQLLIGVVKFEIVYLIFFVCQVLYAW